MIIGVELRRDLTLPSVRIFSDAATSDSALQEIASWALVNHYVPLPAASLTMACRDGKDRFFAVACSDRAIAAAGRRIYSQEIGPAVEAAYSGGTVAVDVLSGAYVVGACREAAEIEMRKTHPCAVISLIEIGFRSPAQKGQGRTQRLSSHPEPLTVPVGPES